MRAIRKQLFFLLISFITVPAFAQLPDMVYKPNIKCVRFHMYGDQLSLPVYTLNSSDQLELNFDDLDANVKSYYYSFQLCDYNWKPVDINPFLYTKGFIQQRISTNRYSSIAFTKYTHYQAIVPDRTTTITLSGNYLLKVFLDGDTSKLAFTRRMFVLDSKAAIAAKVVQPFTPQFFNTHQKIQFNANITGLTAFSAAQQVKVVILQNNRWDNAIKDIPPTFIRGNSLEYSSESNSLFPGGKEWRWLDLRSFRLQSDRVDSAWYGKTSTDVFVKPDRDRSGERYVYFRDYDGMFVVETYETINPYWQGDFATVHFTFTTPDSKPVNGKDIYLAGQMTDYALNDKTKMQFNEAKGVYEGTAFLKQGYYSYTYISVDKNNPQSKWDMEGNYWETENSYTILMYYKGFTDRADQLIGIAKINSRSDRAGVSF
ncbi:type IX secretion system plug protein [Ferruginibacter sp.]